MSKADQERISGAILELVPQDGSSIGNTKLLGALRETWPDLEDEDYFRIWDALTAADLLATACGPGYRKRLAILIILENIIPRIPPRHQVIQRAFEFNAELSRHAASIYNGETQCNTKDLTHFYSRSEKPPNICNSLAISSPS